MLSNAYFLAKFRFDTAENEPAKNLQNFKFCKKFQNLPAPVSSVGLHSTQARGDVSASVTGGEPRRSASPPHARASPRMRAALGLSHAASARLIIFSLASVESDGSFFSARLLIMFSEIYEHIKQERKPEATTIHVFMAFSFRRLIQIASRKMQTL